MSGNLYLHDRKDFADLLRIVAHARGIQPLLVEKDYWIMHCLHGLRRQGFTFELKGGTSLSKGFGIIQRFSEDIDVRIDPVTAPFDVATNPSHTKKQAHIDSRRRFFDWLAEEIAIPGVHRVERDTDFDDAKYRSGGIRLIYPSVFDRLDGIKDGILLEVGFDDTAPNLQQTISSWAYDHAAQSQLAFADNRAIGVPCYHPGYTLVEKLQTISTKFRKQQATGEMPKNFVRHYYDVAQLLGDGRVRAFIRTPEYAQRKDMRFPAADNKNIAQNAAFLLSDPTTRELYTESYAGTRALYYAGQPPFESLLQTIVAHIHLL